MKPKDTVVLLGTASAPLGAPLAAAAEPVSAAMAGQWEGHAHVIVDWCQNTNLPVSLAIAPDGKVSGKVGDAQLSNAWLKRNRGWLGRKLNIKTDYIVVGDLTGDIVRAEQIKRSGVTMPVNFIQGSYKGGLHTSGTKFGRKESGILSAGIWLTNVTNVTPR